MARRPGAPDWAGVAAVVIAAGLVFGWSVSLILSSTPYTADLGGPSADILSGIGQVLAGALATFIGTRATPDRTPKDKVLSNDQ